MKGTPRLLAPAVADGAFDPRGLSQFLSRSFRMLHLGRRPRGARQRVRRLVESVRWSGSSVSRLTSPSRLLRECDRSYETLYRELELGSAADSFARGVAVFLPGMFVDEWSKGDVEARRIRTVGELLEEGRRQQNCVGAYVKQALREEVLFYSVRIAGRPLTLEISRDQNGRPFISEVAGFANRVTSDAELAALGELLEAIGAKGAGR